MKINNIIISEEKLAKLSSILPESMFRDEYTLNGLSDIEIGAMVGLSVSWVCKLRKIYGVETDPNYQLRRNKMRFESLSARQKEFLHGSLLGDSCIAVQASGQGYWRCRHCIAQESYLLKKAEIMKPFTAKVSYGERAFEQGGKLFKYVDGRTFTHPEFTAMRSRYYPNGEKVIDSELVSRLTPSGFAFWFLDDGSTTGYGFDITTYNSYFRSKEAITVIKDILNLDVSIRWDADGEGKIHVLKSSHDLAWQYIETEIISCFCYKIPKRYRTKDNQQPSLDGNVLEGSTTEGSLISSIEEGDNTYSDRVIYQNMPETCDEQVVIQSELVGNYER